jgi:hypothetical protein
LELGLLGDWIRFWYQGELLELPDTFRRTVDELKGQLSETQTQAKAERRRAQRAQRQAEAEKVRADQAEREKAALAAELARLRSQFGQQPPANS